MKLDVYSKDYTKISTTKLKKFKLTEQWNDVMRVTGFTSGCATEKIYCYEHGLTELPKCACGAPVKFYTFRTGYKEFCSVKCAAMNENRAMKSRETMLKKYGTTEFNNAQKRKKTCLEKYGVESYFESEDFKRKSERTIFDKYGVTNISQSSDVKMKKNGKCGNPELVKKTWADKKRNDPSLSKLLDPDWLDSSYENKTIVQIGDDLGVAFSTVSNALKAFDIERNKWRFKSGIENEVKSFIESLGFQVEQGNRTLIAPLEIDLYIREKNLAIEVDGMYWHSISTVEDNTKKNIEYHKYKTDACEKIGISLLHITDYEWTNSKDIWKSMIRQKLGLVETKIFARKCVVQHIDKNVGKKFVDENHLQGHVNGGSYVGLMYDGELISVMQIGASRFNKNYDYEILRFCSKKNHSVIGGFSRLLSNFGISGKVVSYANRRWSAGNLYKQTGFECESVSSPNYWYWKSDTEKGNRTKFQKHKLKSILKFFDETKTEFENMIANGYKKFCDCGNLSFSIELS